MKVVFYVVSALFSIIGLLAIILGPWLPGFEEVGVKRTALGFILLAWGLAFGCYAAKSYRGGIATVVGLLLLGIGVWNGLGDFIWQDFPTKKDMLTNVFASLFLCGAGIALLVHGHKVHRSRITSNSHQ